MTRGPCLRAVKVGDQERIELELEGSLSTADAMNLALQLQTLAIEVARRNIAARARAVRGKGARGGA